MGRKEKAEELFTQGYNCAQAVFLAYADRMDMDEKTAAKLASSFGGGMGCLREVCGAVSGMFMVTGMLYGYDDPKAPEEKKEHYRSLRQNSKNRTDRSSVGSCLDWTAVRTARHRSLEQRSTIKNAHVRS